MQSRLFNTLTINEQRITGEAWAHALAARGISRGDRVAVFASNSLAVVDALLGHHRAGVVHVPINPGYQEAELAHILEDSGAKMVLVDRERREIAQRVAHVPVVELEEGQRALGIGHRAKGSEEDVAILIYTSGTTGKAKGCPHTLRGIEASIGSLMALWGMSDRDVLVHALPLFHVHGLCVALHGALITGAKVDLLDKFSPEGVVESFRRGGTVFMGVPTMYTRLLKHLEQHPDDCEPLKRARLFTAGSAALSPRDLEKFEVLTGHRILERYGMSETMITLSNPLNGERRAGSVGKPIDGVEIRVDDDELLVKGPGVIKGYWNQPAFSEEWFRTGDTVRVDDDGYISIVGRTSTDILKVGGYKISAREIEEQLATHPNISEVAVIGIPDDEWGQKIVACVVAKGVAPTLDELQDHVKLHASKKPRAIIVLDALPRNALGKVQKTKLVEMARSDGTSPSAT
jgi:acyl-CoA synthetase (AMP-forming)/AMP-acid ligase II